MDLEAGSGLTDDVGPAGTAYRMRMAEEELERDRKARALAEHDTGAVLEWGLSKILRFGLVILPIAGGVAWLVWSVIST